MDDILLTAPPMLSASLARWQRLLTTLPAALLRRPPLPGEWSALDCLQHMLDFDELMVPQRLHALRTGGDIPNFEPEEHGRLLKPDTTAEALLADFTHWRTNTLALLAALSTEELAHTGRHLRLGPATVGEFIHEIVGHDLMHLLQAERALQAPFAEGAGPWRQYFEF